MALIVLFLMSIIALFDRPMLTRDSRRVVQLIS
jgi:hypothetical protein